MVRRISHLWRPLNLGRPSNRLAVLAFAAVSAAAAILVTALTEVGIGAGLLEGLRYGVGAFLAWATGRELDPDRTATARAAVLLYLPVAWVGSPDLAATVAVLLGLRIVVRTIGLAPTIVDLAILVIVAGFAATSSAGFVAALGLAWALHADRRLPDPADDRPSEVAAAVAGAVAVTATIVSGAFLSRWEFPAWWELLLVVIVAVAATALRTASVTSTADRTRTPLEIDRLVHGRRLTLVVVAVAICWSGASAIAGLGPVLAAIVGAGWVGAGVGDRLASLRTR